MRISRVPLLVNYIVEEKNFMLNYVNSISYQKTVQAHSSRFYACVLYCCYLGYCKGGAVTSDVGLTLASLGLLPTVSFSLPCCPLI
jgi:hypothetical protein